jgi:hypothetical protein
VRRFSLRWRFNETDNRVIGSRIRKMSAEIGEDAIMEDVDRRSTFVLGLAAASALVFAGSEVAEAAVGDETELAKGVKMKILGEGPAMIPGYKTVRLRDISVQPGSSIPGSAMPNPMVCHITAGELQITQDNEKPFAAKKDFVWTCNTGTKESATNSGSVVAVMRIEPPRVSRRLFGLSHAAMAGSSSVA